MRELSRWSVLAQLQLSVPTCLWSKCHDGVSRGLTSSTIRQLGEPFLAACGSWTCSGSAEDSGASDILATVWHSVSKRLSQTSRGFDELVSVCVQPAGGLGGAQWLSHRGGGG